ncbi:hypothetical protein ASU85_23805 [Klebsiella aerogenes]|uniref:transcriptional regulator SlyA n=1 Tax=Klebsiella aerogenes TaxID=548 RepID=UPI000735A6AD|nr:transcriptional regulator SlyA [Klebsiella aerogenes]KTJ37205.1 hypothetical protein ASU85_23805 [Klebsiella aerogenes]
MEEWVELKILRLTKEWKSIINNALKQYNLTQSGWLALYYLSLKSTEQTQVTLAKLIGVEHPSLVRTIDSLEAKGLVHRIPSARDRRSNIVSLTLRSESIIKNTVNTITKTRLKIFDGFSPEEIEVLVNFFERMQGNLSTK